MNPQLEAEKQLWDREYDELQVIPSTTRTSPSKALLLYAELLGLDTPRRALDAGCGIGRNAVYLAKKGWQVDAIDISSVALRRANELAVLAGVDDRIKLRQFALWPPFPFDDSLFDLTLDSYVFCHLTDPTRKRAYRDELRRVTRKGGFVFSSVFSVEDEYYRKNGLFSMDGTVVTDPHNGIVKQLYTEDAIKTFYSQTFEIRFFAKFEFCDIVLGSSYRRSVFAFVLA